MTLEGWQLKTVMALLLALIALLMWRGLVRRNHASASQINLDDLLLGDDGKMSKAAVVMLGAFGVTTWMMVFLTLQGKMTEGYLGIYVAAWIAPTVTRLVTNRPPDMTPAPEVRTVATATITKEKTP